NQRLRHRRWRSGNLGHGNRSFSGFCQTQNFNTKKQVAIRGQRSALDAAALDICNAMVMRVAFLGLGIMGRPMAANLAKAGNEVAVWNRTPGKTVEGARAAESPADAANGAEVVWMCVSDTRAVEAVLFGPQGVEGTIGSGAIVVDSSTISPSAEYQFAERLKAKGVEY